jgi:hypothetical protein
VEVKGAADAEERTRRFILERHPKATRILFRRVDNMGYSWLVEGEVWFKRLHLFTVKRIFKVQISLETGEAASFQEERPTRFKHAGGR